MDKFYVHQDANFGLGNFINITPAIRAIAEKTDKPVPVYFDLKHVEQCFIDCEFIEILKEQPFHAAPFSSAVIDHKNLLPDFIYSYLVAAQIIDLPHTIGHTYIDTAKEIPISKQKYTLFMYGSGSEDSAYLYSKTPDESFYKEYMKGKCIFTGSTTDFERVDWFEDMETYLDNIRKSLALIRDAELIVSNDTGLAHAAGAMNKNMIVLWKTTALPKNANPGKNTLIKMCI